MIHRGIIAAVVILLLFPGVALAQPRVGAIEGQVVNGTAEGSSVANLEVTLFSMTNDTASAPHVTVQTDSTGHYSFSDVDADSANTYVVGLTFHDADYYSDVQSFSDNETVKTVDLTVYDSTTDDSAISIVNAHTVVFAEDDGLTIQEVYTFANMSDRTYVGSDNGTRSGERETLHFSLPPGFSDLQMGGDLASSGIVATDAGFADTVPVQPGAVQAYYSYRVTPTDGVYVYPRAVDYATVRYSVLVQGENASIKSDKLTSSGTTDMSGAVFTGATGTDLAKGTTFTIEFSGFSAGGSGGSSTSSYVWIGLGVVLLAAAVVGAVLSRRKRSSLSPAVVDGADENELLSELARLDDDFETGRIDESSYQRDRSAVKAELLDLMSRSKGAKTGG